MVAAGRDDAEAAAVLGLRRRQRQRAERAPVEAAVEGDHVRAAGVVAGELERALDRLGAGVGEERPRARASATSRPAARTARRRPGGRSRTSSSGGQASAWACIAAVTAGWAWPAALTAIPALKSRKRLPSTSSITAPEPRADDERVDPGQRRAGDALVALDHAAGDRAGQLGGDPGSGRARRGRRCSAVRRCSAREALMSNPSVESGGSSPF